MSSVDVIVPCYRYGHFLRECVESVLAQSGPIVRILIIDDASPDNTSEVAADLSREESRVTCLRHKTNKGHIATYNEGIAWASADYLLILSADDYLLPEALKHSTGLMDAHPEVGFTFGNVIELAEGEAPPQMGSGIDAGGNGNWQILGGPEFVELSGPDNIVRTPTAVVRTRLQKFVGGYRPELPHSADMEMWLRLAARGSVGRFRANQAVYRRHSGNMSLEYMAQGWLPDLQQRMDAFAYYFQTYNHVLPKTQELHRRLLWLLGCRAIDFASSAFDEGNMELSLRLSEFALGACPRVRTSVPWMKLKLKRRLGSRGWRALRPAVARIRHATSLLDR